VRANRLSTSLSPTPRSRARTASALVAVTVGMTGVGVAAPSSASADIAQQIKDSQARLDQLNSQSEAAAERYNAGRIKLVATQLAARNAQSSVDRDNAALVALRAQMSGFAAQLYRTGPGGPGLSLITTGNPNTYIQQVGTLNEISQSQARVMGQFATATSRQKTAAASAKAAYQTTQATVQGLQKDKAQVESAAGKAQQILQGLQAKQAQLIAAAKDAAARSAAQARATELATEARNAAAAAAAFRSAPLVEQPVTVVPHYNGNAAQIAVRVAMDQLGKPYVYGAAGPDSFDCSGLTLFAYAQAGISLPHYTGDQWNQGHHVAESDLQPGDLVFFEKSLGHMGMYIGNGNFIHAPHTGDVVKISALSGYYQNEYAGAVRL
jgi:cell wall-associated NlpC family hydrolase